MKIAQIVPIWFPVPPKKFGGLESVVANLTAGLISKKHEVTLYGFTSKPWTKKTPELNEAPLTVDWLSNKNIELDNYMQAILDSSGFDILHFHVSTDLFPLMVTSFSKKPTLITVHNFTPGGKDNIFFEKYSNNLVLPNNFSTKFFGKNGTVASVYHGINYGDYLYNEKKDDYLVYLSRIEPEKGILDAIALSKAVDRKLVVLGPVPPLHKDFFNNEVKSLIDDSNVVYLGEADMETKNKYLSKAKALIYPTKYNETFGLVAAEAMACGTPVIAYKSGAVPEVVKDKETGFLAETGDVKELIKVAKQLLELNKEDYNSMVRNCRWRVIENFSSEKMTESYLNLYDKLIGR